MNPTNGPADEPWNARGGAGNLLDLVGALGELPPERQRQRLDELGLPQEQRRQVENWLKALADAGAFLEDTPADVRQVVDRLAIRELGPGACVPPGREQFASTMEISPQASRPRVSRYVLQTFHARGGMGDVWVASDSVIGREVAVKTLRRDGGAAKARFVAEAQVTGRLEHPGIVPVHDVDTQEDGRPFYVMKLVRGRTLKDAIADYHAPPASGDAPRGSHQGESRTVERVRLLKVFVDLCHAIGYAHSRGVIHRDIKPDNVMLGGYGETVVLDWGLAKLTSQSDFGRAPGGPGSGPSRGPSGPPSGHPSGGSSETDAGTVMGTPTYMPPEMADGRNAESDVRTDVYLLGATLYEIVTGRPPRQGNCREDLIELARTTEPTPPRKLSRECQRPLEAIIVKAMSRRKDDRYATAMALAGDVQRYVAGEPVSACPESLPARLWRWCRRHRRGLARAAAAALVVGLVLDGSYLLRRAERQAAALVDRERAMRDVREILRLSDEARYFAASTDAVAERAPYYDPASALTSASAALQLARSWGTGLDRLPLADERMAARKQLYELTVLMAQTKLARSTGREAAEEALTLLDRARTFIDQPTHGYYRLRAQCDHRLGNRQDEADDQARSEDPTIPSSASDLFSLGEGFRTAADERPANSAAPGQEDSPIKRAIAEYRQALRLEPNHFWSQFQLARCYLALAGSVAEGKEPGEQQPPASQPRARFQDAVEALGACVALQPNSPWAYSARGLALTLQRRFDEAEADLNRAVELSPDFRPARVNRGVLYQMQGRDKEALAEFTAALGPPDNRSLPEAAYYRGQLRLDVGDTAEAVADFSRALALRPKFRPARLARARAFLMRDEPAKCLGDLDAALAPSNGSPPSGATLAEQRARLLVREIAADLPSSAGPAMLRLAEAQLTDAVTGGGHSMDLYLDFGWVMEYARRVGDAVRWYSRAVDSAPESAKPRIRRGWAYVGPQLHQDRLAQADFEEALRLDPGSAEARTGLGFVLARQKSPGSREAAARDAVYAMLSGGGDYLVLHNVACIYAELARSDPDRADEHLDLVISLLKRAVELWRRGGTGPDERRLIEKEAAFHLPALKSRPDYQKLLDE